MNQSDGGLTDRYIQWMTYNAIRVMVVLGFLLVVTAGIALQTGDYENAIMSGFVGGVFLGGWPTVRHFARHPLHQLFHWYYILTDARRIHHFDCPDGTVQVSEMRPTRTGGWTESKRIN